MDILPFFIANITDPEGVQELLLRGHDPNSQDEEGRTPLHVAIMKNERNPQETGDLLLIARDLINFGANVDQVTHSGKTPLHLAVGYRISKMVELLLESHAQVNAVDDHGYTALHYATAYIRSFANKVYDPDVGVLILILKYNPKLDAKSIGGLTPLMLAVRSNDSLIVNELLNKKASADLHDVNGNTAMYYALSQSEVNEKIVLELARHGALFQHFDIYNSPITFYLWTLKNATRAELEKSKYVIKLHYFYTPHFHGYHQIVLSYISNIQNYDLFPFILDCMYEIVRMRDDEFSPSYRVYDIALRGANSAMLNSLGYLPTDDSDEILSKLLQQQYFIYPDLICPAICRKYMRKKFAQVCCRIKTDTKFFNSDMLYVVSSYLSNYEMLNMMIASSVG